MTEHLETPFQALDGRNPLHIFNASGRSQVLTVTTFDVAKAVKQRDEIIRRVNAHDDLVAACLGVLADLRVSAEDGEYLIGSGTLQDVITVLGRAGHGTAELEMPAALALAGKDDER